jgi:hypothetical protein
MDVIYAAEKRSIAELLGHHVHRDIGPEDIDVADNPSQTGSFFIGWGLHRYVLSPAGEIAVERSRRFAVEASRTPSQR